MTQQSDKAWRLASDEFPMTGTSVEKLIYAVRCAVLAPSPYNTQPWAFDIQGATVSVYADRRYGLPVTDPDDRGMVIAVSSALYNLCLALRVHGEGYDMELMPDPSRESLIAKVGLTGQYKELPGDHPDHARFKALTDFSYNRGVFAQKPVPADLLKGLRESVAAENAWLYIVPEAEKETFLQMVPEADLIQLANQSFRRELSIWSDRRRVASHDGLPAYAQGFSKLMNSRKPHVMRRFLNKDGEVVSDEELIAGVPVLAILGSVTGGPLDRIATGQAFMRACLKASAAGLSVSPLSQLCEVPEVRLKLHDALSQQGRAHMALRIGYAETPPEKPDKRPLGEVLTIEGVPYCVDPFQRDEKEQRKGGFFRRFSKVFLAKQQ
ncbi:MAG: hypothetical protein AB7E85_05335 [Pseudobdellovibrionaceae bacterium]